MLTGNYSNLKTIKSIFNNWTLNMSIVSVKYSPNT